MTGVADLWEGLYMLEILTDDLYDRATEILREVKKEGGGDEVHQIR